MSVTIRTAAAGDEGAILRMIKALASYENALHAVHATEASLRATLFGEAPAVFAFIAEQDGRARGLALWFMNYSTWTGRNGIYLEDLFVDASARGLGLGRRLIAAVAAEAKRRDCARVDWAVLDWNTAAMRFYRRIGAVRAEGWQPWRLEGEALDRLATGGDKAFR